MSSKDENEKLKEEKENKKLKEENENENDYENEDEDEDETMSQNKINEMIKDLNDNLDEIIDKSKSFEDQIELLKKLEDLKEYLFMKDFDDKELKFKYFKIQLADMSNDIDEKLFEQIFGHTLIKLADELINTINKEKNQIIVNDIHKNKDKIFKRDNSNGFDDWLIQQNSQRINLLYTIDLILNFNEDQLDLV